MKTCSACKKQKEESEFYKSVKRRDGLANECKQCTKSRVQARYRSLPRELRNKPQFHRRDNIRKDEKRCTRCGKWLPIDSFTKARECVDGIDSICRECKKKKFSEWTLKKRELGEYKEYTKRQYWKNREKRLEYHKRWASSPEGLDWYNKNSKKRRGIKNGATTIPITEDEWQETLRYFDYNCVYCKSEYKIEQDHFVPLFHSGRHAPGNLVPACHKCNSGKRNNLPEIWVIDNFGKEVYDNIIEYLKPKRQV